MSGFAKGADVSWLTEMEKDGVKFYNQNGKATECMKLLREEGTNSIRLRVWVNPEGGWCGKDDVIAKAWRAQQLGFRLMIDFHYSDTWADPGNQKVPAAWQGYTAEQMKQAVADHTKDILKALKDRGVTNVEWVQVGNETRDGMLFNSDEAVTGQVSKNADNFAAYINAGYDAVKEVYPNAKVIVHVDKGQDLGGLTWLYDKLKDNGGKWDVIGLSLYPEDDNWQSYAESCLSNIQTLSSKYGKDVIISEIGMEWSSEQAAPMMKKWWMAARLFLPAKVSSIGNLRFTTIGNLPTIPLWVGLHIPREPSTTAANQQLYSMHINKTMHINKNFNEEI